MEFPERDFQAAFCCAQEAVWKANCSFGILEEKGEERERERRRLKDFFTKRNKEIFSPFLSRVIFLEGLRLHAFLYKLFYNAT